MNRFLVVALVLWGCQLDAQNWHRFRGTTGKGVFPTIELPIDWSSQDYLWSIKLPGVGHSSPVIWEEIVFTTCASPDGKLQFVLALDARNGKEIWKKSFPFSGSSIHKFNSYASSTPAVDQDYVFVSWATEKSNDLHCFDHKGKEVWRKSFGAYKTQHGNGFSPTVYGNFVVLTHDHEGKSAIIALNRHTGEQIWKVERVGSKPSASTPCAHLTEEGKLQFVSSSKSHGCYAIDANSGKIAWETGPDTLDKRSVSSPYFAHGYFFASCGAGGRGSRFLFVKPPVEGNPKASVARVLERNIPYVPTSLVLQKVLLLLSDAGILTGIDLKSGEILWRERIGGNYFASPVATGKTAYAITTDGQIKSIQITNNGVRVLDLDHLRETTHNTPAFSKSGIFIRTFSRLLHLPKL